MKRKNVTATALAIFGTATVAAVTACSSPAPLSLGQQIAPGSAAVPCSAIAGQLSYLARYPIYSVEVITNGFHNRMDMSINGQLFIGSYNCTNIGDVNNPSGEVRGCLSIFNTTTNTVLIPPDNGDATGLQSFTSRNIEYVAQGGVLRVYDTTKNILLINDFLPQGTINIVGKVTDIKAIDFF